VIVALGNSTTLDSVIVVVFCPRDINKTAPLTFCGTLGASSGLRGQWL